MPLDLDASREWIDQHGTLRDWQVIGPFANERGGGFDVAYGEMYDKDTRPRRDDNGVYAFIPNDRVWEDNCFARVRKALSILNGTTSEIPFVLGYKKTPPVDRVIDGQSFVRGFSGFQFRRIRCAAISMTTLTVRGSDRIVLANGLRMPVNNVD